MKKILHLKREKYIRALEKNKF